MSDRTNGPEFPKHFDGRHFYNPDARQARGFLDVIQWKLTSRPDTYPSSNDRRWVNGCYY